MNNALKISVVEDEEIVAEDLRELLTEAGYNVLGSYSNGTAFLDAIETEAPDCVLLDIKIEGPLDGIQVAERLSEKRIPFIFLTAFADEKFLSRARVTEPYGYLVKPYKPIDLLTTISISMHRNEVNINKAGNDYIKKTKELSGNKQYIFHHLNQLPFLNGLPEEALAEIASSSTLSVYKSYDTIISDNLQKDSGFIVLKGRIAISKSSIVGKDLIVELLPPLDDFGLLTALDDHRKNFTLRARKGTEVVWIPKALLVQIFEDFPEIGKKVYNSLYTRLRKSHDMARSLAHDRVEVRIASALLALIPSISFTETSESTHCIPMTRQELADITGTTLETCVRVTKKMEKQGVLDLKTTALIRVLNPSDLEYIIETPT